jgi:hypothetical protein
LEELIKLTSQVDRIKEFDALLERGLEKAKEDRGEVMRYMEEESPLNCIKFLLKVRKGRPQWTYRVDENLEKLRAAEIASRDRVFKFF